MPRILLLQNDRDAAERLSDIIMGTSGLEFMGCVRTLAHARPLLEHDTIDLLLSDLRLDDGRPTTLVDELRGPGRRGRPLLLVVAKSFQDAQLMYALRHGADGYVVQGRSKETISGAIMQVLGGGAPMSPEVARQVRTHFPEVATTDRHALTDPQGPLQLTLHERLLLDWLCAGHQTHEIARSLRVTTQQVDVRVRNIYRKMQFDLRVAARTLLTV